ncbi:hypothetical protein [Hespellia stercorisuis]|uniref:Uncharacterized protein n=1 Tax=Hespellia stercorisuis DSM 15480 TaxID=1121950 RepID=A0A1M6NUY3_9FIRM|nr:hypothetical protein [Hespellia stercorisuis]SHJ99559.1 hypothetical protein SAMN02745243_01917 [Hespellia stercorisuis DSM 15480]
MNKKSDIKPKERVTVRVMTGDLVLLREKASKLKIGTSEYLRQIIHRDLHEQDSGSMNIIALQCELSTFFTEFIESTKLGEEEKEQRLQEVEKALWEE